MSFMRSAIPVVLAVGFGIFNAQYIFKPALEEEARRRDQQAIDKGNTQNPTLASANPSQSQTPTPKS
ncbi:hypothetical protein E8E14_014173 [Neopestalotiopsis sp. 37M]|nr:hypothetical protein E8E14_014173 [Neopestalotiopsis sp. 37M]